MVDLGANREIVIREIVSLLLKILAALADIGRNLRVLCLEFRQVLAEFGGLAPPLDLDLTSDGLELVDVAGADLDFDREQPEVELVLICL